MQPCNAINRVLLLCMLKTHLPSCLGLLSIYEFDGVSIDITSCSRDEAKDLRVGNPSHGAIKYH